MKKRLALTCAVGCIALLFSFIGCSSGNLEEVKSKAPEIWKQNEKH